ncbi:hypothetical protein QO002_003405 [Pararhizobium capsulatum DSM 1112]|uniref:DUF1993 domain-containing protein n=1 Tax=Pararhizobium capsulatum DSM 1112 TaxID=1121113 RepID=A0ABU0BSM4_9HYPH|nr:DUF1993 domain-containing protein [Pararhizobium capsulatum]MDQ0321267.1 hypothetical protein [Pararhizobium capsulatum DSM 1112]
MSVSTYSLSIPVFLRGLAVLSAILAKAKIHATENAIPLETLFNARLAPDMLTLAGQIQRVSDTSKNAVGRLTTITAAGFPDTEQSFEELEERVHKTIAFLETVTPQDMEGSGEREVAINLGKLKYTFTGTEYLLTFAIPNFFFHLTTAYDILRNQGVPVGKIDYLGTSQAAA